MYEQFKSYALITPTLSSKYLQQDQKFYLIQFLVTYDFQNCCNFN
jgi:hypothetical protein